MNISHTGRPEKESVLATSTGRGVVGLLLLLLAGGMVWQCSRSDTGEAAPLRIHLISGSAEYESEQSLKKLTRRLKQTHSHVVVTASWGEDEGEHLPNIAQLARADVMVLFARRLSLPEEELQYITRHIAAEKPVIGIRTASHAIQNLLTLDATVFGGDYEGHGEEESVYVRIGGEAAEHPILQGVDAWLRPGKLYHNPELGPNTQVLLEGRGMQSNRREPLAWTNNYGDNGRAFYTSMGLPSDFDNDQFLRMLTNALDWVRDSQQSGSPDEEARSSTADLPPGSYRAMDYGPVLSESIHLAGPDSGLVRKGLAIRLDQQAAMIFDTDMVGFAAGAAAGWLDISDTDYTSYKGSDIAAIEGRQVFGSPGLAGWAKEGRFEGPREDRMGPLPRDWAQYKGYYRYGDQVVLSYRVGDTDVLEVPGAIREDHALAFLRTLRVGTSERPLQALIATQREDWSVRRRGDRELLFDTGADDTTFAVSLIRGPQGTRLVAEGGRIALQLPPSETPRTVQVMMAEMPSPSPARFRTLRERIEQASTPDLLAMTRGGRAAWDQPITLEGTVSDEESGYVMDRLPIPFENPWGSWMRLSGLDFFADGRRAAVSTWNGDVWIVSGLDKSLKNVKWRRFASGLFYPMGVAVVDGEIIVTERSQLTRLHDLNGNGEADYYENINNDGIVYPMAHSLGLEVDVEGNFYFFKNGNRVPGDVPQHGALMRVSPDGTRREVYARGFRGANTLGIGPDGQMLSADQEGNWMPTDRIDGVQQGGFYGYRRHGGEALDVGDFDPPIVWTPQEVNNSSGSMTFADDERWGPLAGHWLLGSYGQANLLLLLTQQMGEDRWQGGVVPMPVASESGLMRGKVNPGDGQLYVVGLRGWTTLGSEDASFERIRYAGGPVYLPKGLRMSPEGIEISFPQPLDSTRARQVANYEVQRWEYRYSEQYGSPDMSLEHPGEEGRDTVAVSSATVSEDGKKVFLSIPDMRAVMQMKIGYDLIFADGHQARNAVYATVNWLSESDAAGRPEWQQRIIARQKERGEQRNPPNEPAIAEQQEDMFAGGEAPAWFREGKQSFQHHCSECHSNGGVAPSFDTSKWAEAASPEAMIRILLHGKRGDRGIMTPFSWLGDEQIASLVSYIRARWHDYEEPIPPAQVQQIRAMTQKRAELWTDKELESILE